MRSDERDGAVSSTTFGAAWVEGLEPRLAMDAAFASVGLHYEPRLSGQDVFAFATEGLLSDTLAASGSRFKSDSDEREFDGNLRYNSISNIPDGRFERTPPEGYTGRPAERNGAQFLNINDYPAGWWFGQYSQDVRELELLVQRPLSPVTLQNFQGEYRYSQLWNDSGATDTRGASGRLTINATELTYNTSAGTAPYTRSRIDSVEPAGSLLTARGEYVYLSASGSTIILADMASEDDIVTLAVATRLDAPPEAADMIGGYLLAWNNSTTDLEFTQLFLDLEEDGDYKFYDLDEYDDGQRDSIERGFWSVDGGVLTLRQADTNRLLHFTIGEDGKLLVGMDRQTGEQIIPAFGLAVRAQPNGPVPMVVFPVGAVNEFDRGAVYELESDDAWFVTDLVQKAGGPTIAGKIVAWTDPKDGLSYAAGVAPEGLVLYSSTADHQWSFRVLTAEAAGPAMTAELQAMLGPDGIVHLTGLDAQGHLLRHYQTGARNQNGQWIWAFENISTEDLEPNGEQTPAFTGLVSYATAWNGLNVAGLDAEGTIWSVWWAPGLAAWTVSDLTTTYGALPLTGGLTVYLTPWQGINIAGIDENGQLQVTWWVPAFGGTWAQSNLTEITAGPQLVPGTVSSYVSSWGGLNIAGIDTATGDLFVYWTAPGTFWSATSLTDVVPAGSPALAGPLMGFAGPDSSLNVFGYNTDHFIRYYWEPEFGGSWFVQDLTAIATPR